MFEKVVFILVPIFLTVGLGYVSGRLGVVGDTGASILGRFVMQVSLPLFLFGSLASESLENIINLHFIASFGAAALICFLIPLMFKFRDNVAVGIRAMRGLGSSFGSIAFMGIPVLTPLIGNVALPAVGIANIIVLILVAITIVLIEVERSSGSKATSLYSAIGIALFHTFTNPLVFCSAAGLAFSFGGFYLPNWLHRSTQLVGAAAPPVALFALGAALIKTKLSYVGEIALLGALKLIAMPLITLGVLMLFPQVDPKWAVAAVVMAALATAVLEFMIGEEYHIYPERAAALVLLTTMASAITLPIFIILTLHIWPLK